MTVITKKIGFACKYSYVNNKGIVVNVDDLNTNTTTITYLNKLSKPQAEQKMLELLETNINNTHNMVMKVATLRPELRMVRLTSDMLIGYTHPDWSYFYKQVDVISKMERMFALIGETARLNDVRLSFHPGQFTVLASETPRIVDNSISEFEYHVDMARMMGYGKRFQDFKVNVHISGRLGPQGIIDVLPRLSPEARNMITIENDEMSWGLDASLELVDHVALVLDIHHHWVNSGEYIQSTDDRIKRVIDSWRGERPVVHYSVSREDCLKDHCIDTLPDMNDLLAKGYKKQQLRAHSDYMWNNAVNDWAKTHNEWADCMVECKNKNIGSQLLFAAWNK